MRRFAHVVNLAVFPEGSELHAAQPVTLETMRLARDFAMGSVEVTLLSAQFSEDRSAVPAFFAATRDLDRSVLDVGEFKVQRRLPLAKDILDRAYEADESDFIIYTNVDICLMPGFYSTVDRMIDSGLDAFVINRRSIPADRKALADIPLMWAEVGRPHMGFDCFVFRREAYRNFDLGVSCFGAPHIGKILLANQVLNARAFRVFLDSHLTFHLGNEKRWASKALRDYEEHNKAEFERITSALEPSRRALVRRTLADAHAQGLRRKLTGLLGLGP